MRESEYKALRAAWDREATAFEQQAAAKRADVVALDRVWELLSSQRAAEPIKAVELVNGSNGHQIHGPRSQTWRERLLLATDEFSGVFNTAQVQDRVFALFPVENNKSNCATISGGLKRLQEEGILESVSEGRGGKPSEYRRKRPEQRGIFDLDLTPSMEGKSGLPQ